MSLAFSGTGAGAPAVEPASTAATRAMLALQRNDGHWVFELEADCTIPAEYVLLRHFRGEPVDAGLERKIAVYLRRIQGAHGGWALFRDGDFDMSASVKAYFALKMIGDTIDAPHMARAREAILSRGGGVHSNVFTRALLALYGILRWEAVPEMPVEITLLPRWFPFHLTKVSYWARTVLVPLLVLQAEKPVAKNPRGIGIDELFVEPPSSIGPPKKAPHQNWGWFLFFRGVDIALRPAVKYLFPKKLRRRAIDRAVEFVTERLNGEDGLGAIFPAMANSVLMYDVLGDKAHAASRAARSTSCWSSASTKPIASLASRRCGIPRSPPTRCSKPAARPRRAPAAGSTGCCRCRCSTSRATGWRGGPTCGPAAGPSSTPTRIIPISTTPPWWSWPWTAPGATMASRHYDAAIARATEWVKGLQSENGGWAAFDADNTYYYLNNIPFADHGALLDPPTEDVTARCLSMLAQLGETDSGHGRSAGSITCAKRSLPTAAGTAVGGSTTSTAPGRCCARSMPAGSITARRKSRRRSTGSSPSRTRTAAGAKTARATGSTTAAMSRRRARPRRPPGRCSA